MKIKKVTYILIFILYVIVVGCNSDTNPSTVDENNDVKDQMIENSLKRNLEDMQNQLKLAEAQVASLLQDSNTLTSENSNLKSVIATCQISTNEAIQIMSQDIINQHDLENVLAILRENNKIMEQNNINYSGTLKRNQDRDTLWMKKFEIEQNLKDKFKYSLDSSVRVNKSLSRTNEANQETISNLKKDTVIIKKQLRESNESKSSLENANQELNGRITVMEKNQNKMPSMKIKLDSKVFNSDGDVLQSSKGKFSRKKVKAISLILDIKKLPLENSNDEIFINYYYKAENDTSKKFKNIYNTTINDIPITYSRKVQFHGVDKIESVKFDSLPNSKPGIHVFTIYYKNCNCLISDFERITINTK